MTVSTAWEAVTKWLSGTASQKAFSMFLVVAILYGVDHWASEYFTQIMVPRSAADIETLVETRKQGTTNALNLTVIAANSAEQTALLRQIAAGMAGEPEEPQNRLVLTGPKIPSGHQADHEPREQQVEENSARE